jgi:hypothetical protein
MQLHFAIAPEWRGNTQRLIHARRNPVAKSAARKIYPTPLIPVLKIPILVNTIANAKDASVTGPFYRSSFLSRNRSEFFAGSHLRTSFHILVKRPQKFAISAILDKQFMAFSAGMRELRITLGKSNSALQVSLLVHFSSRLIQQTRCSQLTVGLLANAL